MEWDNLTYIEMGEVYYGGVAFEADMAIENKDVVDAQKVKVKVNKLLHACISAERTRPMMRLIGKYAHLDSKLLKFILRELRHGYASLPQEN